MLSVLEQFMVFSEFIIIVFATVDLRWLVGFHHAVLHHGRDDLLISGLYRPKCLELVQSQSQGRADVQSSPVLGSWCGLEMFSAGSQPRHHRCIFSLTYFEEKGR